MLIGAVAQYFFGFTIFVLSLFLVLLVLVQRGRGGGLTGALGGPGGQSAFGTKAGDLFTRITVGVAAAWIILCASAVFVLRGRGLPETGVVKRAPASIASDINTDPSKVEQPSSASPTGPLNNGGAVAPVDNSGAKAPASTTPTAPNTGTSGEANTSSSAAGAVEKPALTNPAPASTATELPATPPAEVTELPATETPPTPAPGPESK